jgi:hypothetical protein
MLNKSGGSPVLLFTTDSNGSSIYQLSAKWNRETLFLSECPNPNFYRILVQAEYARVLGFLVSLTSTYMYHSRS